MEPTIKDFRGPSTGDAIVDLEALAVAAPALEGSAVDYARDALALSDPEGAILSAIERSRDAKNEASAAKSRACEALRRLEDVASQGESGQVAALALLHAFWHHSSDVPAKERNRRIGELFAGATTVTAAQHRGELLLTAALKMYAEASSEGNPRAPKLLLWRVRERLQAIDPSNRIRQMEVAHAHEQDALRVKVAKWVKAKSVAANDDATAMKECG